ncbi:MAG: DUF1631 family protein [Pseudomonadota bacterium]
MSIRIVNTAVTTPVSDAERRRADRCRATRAALLILKDGQNLKGEIQDFCWGGLFIELEEDLEPIQDYYRRGQSQVEIVFADAEYTSPVKFRLDARIVRVTPMGIGFQLHRTMPGPVYSDLGCHAKSTAANGKSLSPQAVACDRLFRERLPTLLTGFWEGLQTSLLRAAVNAQNNIEQNRFYEAITLLREQSVAITQAFQSAALASTASFDPDNTQTSPVLTRVDVEESHFFGHGPNQDGDAELALVGYDDMDDWVSLVVEIKRLKEYFTPTLADLEARLIPVIPSGWQNPFTPGMLGDALHQALGKVSLSLIIRRVLYQLFRESITAPLEQLYRLFLSELKPVSGRARLPARPVATADPRKPALETPPPDAAPAPVETAPPAVPKTAQAWPSAIGTTRDNSPDPLTGTPSRPSGLNRGAFSLLAAQQNFYALQDARPQTAIPGHTAHAETDNPAPPPAACYSTEEVAARLTQWVSSETPVTRTGTPDLMRQAGLEPERLTPEQQHLVELSAGLLHRILQEARLPQTLTDLLARLQRPLTHLAFMDPGFIQSDGHPAKQFLNLFDDLAIGINDGGEFADPQLKQLLSDAMAHIQQDYPAQPEVFEEVLTALTPIAQRLVGIRSANQARVLAACEGKQRLLETRRHVDRRVHQHIAGRTIPAVVADLLAAGWQDLLALVALRSGLNSEAWTTHFRVIENLLAWLDPKNPRAFGPGDAVRLFKVIETQLRALNLKRSLAPLLGELMATLLGEGSPRVRRSTRFTSVPALLSEPPSGVPSASLMNLQTGDWLEFETSQGPWRLLRLLCAGEISQEYVFIDRKGLKRLEIKFPELKQRLNLGKARPMENLDTPLVERMTFRMMQEINDRLLEQANQDPLTNMINRRGFLGALERAILGPQGRFGRHLLMVLELQRFRAITSNCGIEAGDKLLKTVAEILRSHLGSTVLMGRLGDTTFGVLMMAQPLTRVQELARGLVGQITQRRFRWANQAFTLGAVVGLAEIEPQVIPAAEALKRADTACFVALQRGGDQIHYYQEGDNQQQQQEMLIQWAGRIDQALQDDRLFLRAQPIVPLDPNDHHSHFEILLGMRDEQGTILSPGEFLPAVEHWGRMADVDRRIVTRLFDWIREDPKRLDRLGGFAVNLSGQSLNDPAMLTFLEQQVETAGFPMDQIVFEITESVALQGFHQMQTFIRQLRRYGCRFSLDDFGSGYSSYAYLKHLEVDYLKIDGSLVKDLDKNAADRVVVQSINEVAHSMALKTIAEYIENQAVLDILKDIGVDYAQGYFVGKPRPLDYFISAGEAS